MNIYVGNLPYSFRDDDLRTLFEKYGTVTGARVIMDRDTNKSKGFGFVEMADDQKAKEAIAALNKSQLSGRELKISEAQPRDNTRSPRRY